MWRRRTSPITSSGDRTLGDGRPAPPPRQGLSLQTAHLGTWRVAGPQRKENLALDIYINESLNLSYKVFINLSFPVLFHFEGSETSSTFCLVFSGMFLCKFHVGTQGPQEDPRGACAQGRGLRTPPAPRHHGAPGPLLVCLSHEAGAPLSEDPPLLQAPLPG